MTTSNKFPLKLLIDTKTNKVLFAEAGKEVVDFLFSLLALPIGTIVKLVSKKQMVGCIGGLYTSLEQLEDSYLLSEEKKSTLLNPHVFSSTISKDTLLLPHCPSKKYYYCTYCTHYNSNCYITDVSGTHCPKCNNKISKEVQLVGSKEEIKVKHEGGVGFVKGVVTYSIMDDLSVVPMSTISSITLLNKFHVKDLGSLKEKNVQLGIDEGLELLKASPQSKNVLTSVFLGKKQAI